MEKNESRINWIDISKAIAIIMVVIFHALPDCKFKFFLGTIQLPIFAFLSGIVFNFKYTNSFNNLRDYIVKKIKRIYIPFILYNLIFLIFHNWFYKINFISYVNNSSIYDISDFFKQLILILSMGAGEALTGVLWYLIPLFECTIIFCIITYLARRISNKEKLCNIIGFIIVFICMMFLSNLDLPRNLNVAMRMMFFYAVGFYMKEYKLLISNPKIIPSIILDCLLFFIVVLCLRWSNTWLSTNLLITNIAAFSGIFAVSNISMLINIYGNKYLNKILVYIGKNSMTILALHMLAFCFVKTIYVKSYDLPLELIGTKAVIADFNWVIIYVIGGVTIPLIIKYTLKKLFSFFIKKGAVE